MPAQSNSKSEFRHDSVDQWVDSLKAYQNLSQVARHLSSSREGRPVHTATVTRWVIEGVRASDGSRIKLRAMRFPSGWRTTLEWVDDFIQAITADRTGRPVTVQGRRTATRRVRELDRIDQGLDKDGY
jgi:hypothetical protein